MGCYIWYSKEGTGRGRSPPRPLLAVPNVTAHPSTASAPINALLYNSPLLCSFNVGVKGLITVSLRTAHDVLSHKASYGPRPKNSRRNRPTLVGHTQAPYQLVWFRIIAESPSCIDCSTFVNRVIIIVLSTLYDTIR